ncbi:MAG: proteasome accessory factor PafA2 family protein [Planctomycetota bacterium]
MVSRLVGMETEYATLVADRQDLDRDDLPPAQLVYQQICEAIRRDQPTVSGLFDHEQMFLASGGAVTFESHPSMHALPGGLIEIATPEVRSPEELLACQRSVDALASEAAAESETSFDLRVLKNSSDAFGHVYGCHENYEVDVAHGFRLVVYRFFILILWAMQVASLLVSLPIMGVILAVVLVSKSFRRSDVSWSNPNDLFDLVPRWIAIFLVAGLRLVHFPTVLMLRFVARRIAFHRQQKCLTAFLASRVALCGTGILDHSGRFQLSAKAMVIDSIADMGGFRGERPVFVFGHWLGQFCAKSFLSLGSTRQMFARKQRLQIGLTDSNMADLAEYVKIGSTSLLLDMIDSGESFDFPQLKRPVQSVHDLASDWNLVTSVATSRGRLSALEIQEIYYRAAEQYVFQAPPESRGEANLVLARWRELLDAVTAFRKDAYDIEAAIGRVDWMTKHWMISELGSDADWTDRKKVDLRYHELSDDGYYWQLLDARPELRLVDQQQIDRRRRSPPSGTPAAKRGWMIREFADSDQSMQSEWTYAIIGTGRQRRRVEFQRD